MAAAAIAVGLATPSAASGASSTVRVSVTSTGAQAGARSGIGNVAISSSGRYVVFASNAAFVPGDTNGFTDIYVRDLVSQTTTRVSVTSSGGQLDDSSGSPVAISPGGRWIVYVSCAPILGILECDQGVRFDAGTGRTRLVGFGLEAANVAISGGGRFIAADNGPFDRQGVVRIDLRTGRTARASTGFPGGSGDDHAVLAGMSASGRFVLFTQSFTMGPPPHVRVFVRDMALRRTRLVSVSSRGRAANGSASGNAISADGRYRMFTSAADNLVPGDTNSLADVFVRIRGSGHTVRVSLSSRGHQANGPSRGLGISADGRFRLFWSEATNLVPGDTNGQPDIFVRDARSGTTFRVDLTAAGAQISRPRILTAAISGDGAWVTWPSRAGHVVPGDTNNRGDVFARGPLR